MQGQSEQADRGQAEDEEAPAHDIDRRLDQAVNHAKGDISPCQPDIDPGVAAAEQGEADRDRVAGRDRN